MGLISHNQDSFPSFDFKFGDGSMLMFSDWYIENPKSDIEHPAHCVEWKMVHKNS